MYFLDALKVLRRRWLVVTIGLLLTGSASVAAVLVVPSQYQASAQVLLLLPPEASGESTPTNPLLNLQGGLTITATLVSGNLSTKDVQRALEGAGFTSEYAIGVTPGTGPLMSISALDTDPVKALATRDEILARLQAELSRIQSDPAIPNTQIIRAEVFSVNEEAEVVPGSRIRALAIIVGVGMTATFIVAFSLDRALRDRSKKLRDRSKKRGRAGRAASRSGSAPEPSEVSERDTEARSGGMPSSARPATTDGRAESGPTGRPRSPQMRAGVPAARPDGSGTDQPRSGPTFPPVAPSASAAIDNAPPSFDDVLREPESSEAVGERPR